MFAFKRKTRVFDAAAVYAELGGLFFFRLLHTLKYVYSLVAVKLSTSLLNNVFGYDIFQAGFFLNRNCSLTTQKKEGNFQGNLPAFQLFVISMSRGPETLTKDSRWSVDDGIG